MFLKKSSLREESDVSVGGGRQDAGEASVPPVECPTPQRTQLFQSVNLDKYILQFGQIYFVIQTNTFIIYAFSRLPDTAKDMQLFLVQTTNWENFLLFTPEKSENVHITMKPRTGKTIIM